MTHDEFLVEAIARPYNINEHLQYLHDIVISIDAKMVVELGVEEGMSTRAFLIALNKTSGSLYSCDIKDQPKTRELMKEHKLDEWWEFNVMNDLDWGKTLPQKAWIDILFIDTSHTLEQTRAELDLFVPMVLDGGMILLHDTESFPAVKQAIKEYIVAHPQWQFFNFTHNNGLGVLTRPLV
jgi:predicted O-methyltransferase YrrM